MIQPEILTPIKTLLANGFGTLDLLQYIYYGNIFMVIVVMKLYE